MYSRKFVEIEDSPLRDPVAIVGLPGIANVGKASVEALIAALGATHYLDFFSKDFPPRITVRDGISHFPKSSMYLYRAAPDEMHDLIILTAEYQPASGQGVFEYAEYVVQEFLKLGVKEVFALAAYEQGYEEFFRSYPRDPLVFVSASSHQLLDRITTINGTVATENGVINGANGFIPAWAANMYNMEGACLLGETLGMIKVDFRAAQMLLEKISSILGMSIDLDILDEQVEKVCRFIEWAKEEIAQKGKPQEGRENPQDRYIG